MTKLLKEALSRVATLPPKAQEKIGEDLLLHVKKIERLRAKLAAGIQSLDRGEGRKLDIKDVIKRARARYGKT